MTTAEYDQFKQRVIAYAKNKLQTDGGVNPDLLLWCNQGGSSVPALVAVPVPGELMDSGAGKDLLVKVFIPAIAIKLKTERKYVLATAFISEAWVRTQQYSADTDMSKVDISKIDLKALHKQDALMIILESEFKQDFMYYELGPSASGKREIKGLLMSDTKADTGRFVGLYKKFREALK